MMENIIYGNNVLIKAKKGDGLFYPFLCVSEVEINKRASVVPTVSATSSGWDEFEFDKRRGWDARLSGAAILSGANGWTLQEIWAAQDAFQIIDIKFIMTDTAGNVFEKSGKILLNDFVVSAAVGDGGELAKWNTILKGTGPLV